MRDMNRLGLAAGLAAALAFYGTAHAQTTTGSAGSSAAPSSQSDQTKNQGAGSAGGTVVPPSDTSTGTAAPSQQGAGETGPGAAPSPGSETGAAPSGSATGSEQSGMQGMSATGEQPKISKTLANDLEKLHAVNQAEISMGQMAEQQGQSPEVKDFGRKLVDDHQKLDEKLQSEASNVGVNLEGKEYQKAQKDAQKSMQKLEGKTGAAFDKEFISMAEKSHSKAAKDASKAAKEARKDKQETLAALFTQADTGIKSHANEAKRISKTVQKEGTKVQGRTPPSESGSGTTGGATKQQESGSTSGSSGSSDMGSSTGTTGKGSGSSATPH